MSAARPGLATAPDAGRPTWADVDRCRDAGLARTSSHRGRKSLEHVGEAIHALRSAHTPITFQAVGAWCVDRHGGPTTQSVQNNERAADIVRTAVAVQAADARPRMGRSIEELILELIGVPALRAACEGLFAHRRARIVEVTDLRAAVRRIDAMAFLSREMAEAGIETLEALAARIKEARPSTTGTDFTEGERTACSAFLSSGMAALGFTVDEPSGEIIDRVQRTVAGPGVASALRKAAGLGAPEGVQRPADAPSRRRRPS